MIDRTNVGLSPLISTPMTTSYVSSVPAGTYQTVPDTTTFTEEAYPTTSYGATQVIDQGVTIPDANTYTQEAITSFAPEITTPDQALSSFIPDTTNVVGTNETTAYPVTTYTQGGQISANTSVVPNVVMSQVPAVQQAAPQSIGPIMDEDFQRGRPIYDEFNEDRYRNFKFGN